VNEVGKVLVFDVRTLGGHTKVPVLLAMENTLVRAWLVRAQLS